MRLYPNGESRGAVRWPTRQVLKSSLGWGVMVAALTAQPVSLAAQSFSLPDRNIPMGSPLDPLAQQQPAVPGSQAAAQSASTAAAQSATRIDPVEINDGSSLDALLQRNARAGARTPEVTAQERVTRVPPAPSEFERYVERALGRPLPRFGADLLIPGSRDFSTPATATVPADYVLNPGDQIFIGLTGSVEGTISADIDNNGRIFIPKVGAVRVAGTTAGRLRSVIEQAAGRQYRNFKVTASVTRLRGIQVYVTGYANNPGAYTVSSLSTMVNAVLAAGGPSAGGSFRSIKLYRNGALVTDFDLYDLILNGNKSGDAVLQNEDVLFIPAVGRQVAVSGSVNAEAIYEAKPGDTLDAMIGYAGGASALADKSRAIVYRLSNLDTVGGTELTRAQLAAAPAEGGDLVQILSSGTLARPLERQSVVVRIDGEVNRPGNYYVAPNTSLAEVLALAGGTTSRAFVFGTNLQRQSVRQQQRTSFQEAVQQLDLSLAAAPLMADTSIDPATRASQIAAARAVLDRLRQTEPDGRIVLNMTPTTAALPGALTLENSDRIFIPARPTTVGVFGAVYRPASFLVEGTPLKRVDQYLRMAGGPLRAADKGEIFVVRANGEVLSRRNGGLKVPVIPGDVIFVPVRTQSSNLWTRILQVSTVAFQLGLAAATVAAVSN